MLKEYSFVARATLGAALAACAGASPALAEVDGSVSISVVSGTVPGPITYVGCHNNANQTCQFTSPIAAGGAGTGTIKDTGISPGQHYAVGNYYITYEAQSANNEGQSVLPECVWYVQISSSSTGSYTGKVSPEPQGDAYYNNGAGYTPTCTAPSLSVNSNSGAWSASLSWTK